MKIIQFKKGFTLVELMIALVMLSFIVAAVISIFIASQRAKRDSEMISESQQTARIIIEMLTEDIRSAGYGANNIAGHNAVVYAAPFDLMISANLAPYPDDPSNPGSPQAIDPSLNPKPGNGLYSPSIKYTDGTETIRYTFDSDNSGTVTTGDRGDNLEETLTPRNTNLYCLVRQVFGYNSVTNTNGGSATPIGLARSNFPVVVGGTPIKPLFFYFVYNSTLGREQVWGDLNGDSLITTDAEISGISPVSSAQLQNITKIGVNVTTETRQPNSKNRIEVVTLNSVVSISRNKPVKEGRVISGKVYFDNNGDKEYNAGDVGLKDFTVQNKTDGQVRITDANGDYLFNVEPRTHNIVVNLPATDCGSDTGYKAGGSLDTLITVTTSNAVKNFPILKYTPGYLNGYVFLDENANGILDSGESGIANYSVYVKGLSKIGYTDSTGFYCLAIEPATDSLISNYPDGMVPTTSTRVQVSVTAGNTISTNFGYRQGGYGYIKCYVLEDRGTIGTYDAEDVSGIGGVRFDIFKENPYSYIYSTAQTDSTGLVILQVGEQDSTNPVVINEIDPSGWFSTNSNRRVIGAITANDTLGPYYFLDMRLDTIRINAANVLCMTVGNLHERQGTAITYSPADSMDADIVLGTKYATTGNVRGWFNKRNNHAGGSDTAVTSLFVSSDTTYYMFDRLTGPQGSPLQTNINAIAMDTMDNLKTKNGAGNNYKSQTRRDIVVGLDHEGQDKGENVIVWPTTNENITANNNTQWGRVKPWDSIPTLAQTPFKLTAVDNRYKVNALALGNFGGDGMPDIAAGFASTTPGQGGFKVWVNSKYESYTGSWSNKQVRAFPEDSSAYWTTGIGEVQALALGSLIGSDTRLDLFVGTKTEDNVGNILVYQGQTAKPWFSSSPTITINAGGEVAAIKLIDFNNDGYKDLIAVVKTGNYLGAIKVWFNNNNNSFGVINGTNYDPNDQVAITDGEPLAMDAAFMNWGSTYPHIVVGLKSPEISGQTMGKTLVYDCWNGILPESGSDPSYGKFIGEVPTVRITDFNRDGHMDIAVTERTAEGYGNLILFYPRY